MRQKAFSITSAPMSPAAELAGRQRRYLISMLIRTICFIGAVLTVGTPWLCITLVIGSFLLPALAVMAANSANPRPAGTPPAPSDRLPDRRD